MPYLPLWKAAKKKFESDTNRKKPSEKFLGIFRKSSGLEDAFKALDTALGKKEVEDAKKAWDKLNATKESYLKQLVAQSNAEHDDNVKKGLDALRNAADQLVDKDSKAEVDGLYLVGDAKLVAAETLGPAAVSGFRDSLQGVQAPLKAWINHPESEGLEFAGEEFRIIECVKALKQAKAELQALVKLRAVVERALPKKMERQQALKLAWSYHDALDRALRADDGLFTQVDNWLAGLKQGYSTFVKAKKLTSSGAEKLMQGRPDYQLAFRIRFHFSVEQANAGKLEDHLPDRA